MAKKRPTSVELDHTERRADGFDWTLTIFLERRRAATGWVVRDSVWPMASQIVAEALSRLPPSAKVHLDIRLPDDVALRQKK